MSTYVFPGQGSQRKGMGRALFDEFPDITERADRILGYSVKKLCTENPNQLQNETQYTQPAVYVVNTLTYLKRTKETGQVPEYVAGHSLGEYNALLAAGVLDFETGLRLVRKRGAAMGRIEGGGMAAVTGLDREQVSQLLDRHELTDIEVANDNAPTQVVVSGLKPAIAAARDVFTSLPGDVGFTELRTSGAFHSRQMAPARAEFAQYLADTSPRFRAPTIPVIANVDAKAYDLARVETCLTEQITQPVRWVETIRHLLSVGQEEFVEVGTGRVLTSLIERIRDAAGSD
ncbi:ACP S-malonyltransferase [Streptomyces sp. NBC_01166]|uniref:ACP S-malonyltransferase n=1 Tax=Streptomyces sp. NBC_01166 TaxID=2903755 RepID=UPI00386AD72C|nr:ACP S-malonyltransferase [Streptomyces sp. NBC_01166]